MNKLTLVSTDAVCMTRAFIVKGRNGISKANVLPVTVRGNQEFAALVQTARTYFITFISMGATLASLAIS